MTTDSPAQVTMRVGAHAAPKTFGPITPTQIVRYAGASGDFNPIHHDDAYAKSAGYPGIFSIGMFQASLLAGYVTDWLGPENLRRITVRFAEQVWPGDELTCSATIDEVRPGDGCLHVGVEIACVRQTGEPAITGHAEFLLSEGSVNA